MKVLHVFGGLRTFKIAKWQALRGVDVHHVMIEDEKPFESYFKNTGMCLYKSTVLTKIYEKIRGKKFLFFRAHMILYPFYLGLLIKTIKKVKPDIIHAYRHTGAMLSIIANRICGSKAKIVFDYQDTWSGEDLKDKSILHGNVAKLFYGFEKWIIKNSDIVVTQGEEQTNLLAKRYNVPVNKMTHTWNTSDKDVFKPNKKERAELRKKYKIDGTAVLYLGSIVDSHGIGLLPKAAENVIKKFPKTKFVMLGVIRDKNYWESLKKEIKSYGIWDNFIEIYPDKKGEIPGLISMCDIGLILHKKGSLIGEISLPSKLFEYLGCGLAIVTSNLKHITRFVIPEDAGVTFEPNSSDDLAKTLNELIGKPAKIKVLGANARKSVENKFNWDKDMERLLNVYNSFIK